MAKNKKLKVVVLFLIILLVFIIALIGSLVFIGSKSKVTITATPVNFPKTIKGVSISPSSFSSTDVNSFFTNAKLTGTAVTWGGDWLDMAANSDSAYTVYSMIYSQGLIPIMQIQVFSQNSGELLRPLDKINNDKIIEYVGEFVKEFQPEYFGAGIEINILYEKNPAGYEKFKTLYSEICDEIKIKSPQTKVFTTFQLEKIKGLNGGLLGGVNDETKTEWALLNDFPKSDLVVFTTYPGLIYKSPADIPRNYYYDIVSHTNLPIGFSEIGWNSNSSPKGWGSNEQEQSEFIQTFFNLSSSLNKKFEIWSFLYDQNTVEPFNGMGLISRTGKSKTGFEEWINAE